MVAEKKKRISTRMLFFIFILLLILIVFLFIEEHTSGGIFNRGSRTNPLDGKTMAGEYNQYANSTSEETIIEQLKALGYLE